MRRRFLLASLVAALVPPGLGRADPPSQTASETAQVGDTAVRLVSTMREPVGIRCLSVHENEQTAVEAARRLVSRDGGRLLELRAQSRRLISFRHAGVRYTFDPNRIFTPAGIEKTLHRYGPYSAEAGAEVGRLAALVIERGLDDPAQAVVAVHNNTDRGLGVSSYLRGGPQQTEAEAVSINAELDPDDFFVVTERAAYDALRSRRFNVVLQAVNPSDDGSLSVYCQRRGISYINVEAQHGHLAEQFRMLEAVQAGLRGRSR